MSKKIGVLVGSLREGSFNKKVAQEIINLLPEGFEGEFVEIGQLPFYNEDIDQGNPPQEYVDFRAELDKYDGFLFQSPEYNRSTTAVLKNALDVGSRPYGESKWAGKPAGVFSASPGAYGGFGANHHLRQSLAFLDMPTMGQPEVYLGSVMESLDEEGNIVERTREFLKTAAEALAAHVEKNSK